MAKSKTTTSTKNPPKPPREPMLSPAARRRVIHALAAFIVIVAAGSGLYVLKRHVSRDLTYVIDPPRVVLKNRPVWMGDYLATQIVRSVRPTGGHSAADKQVLEDTYAALQRNPWVHQVHQVRRVYGEQPGDTIEIDCDFRAPIALVKWGIYYWLVDGNGVKLPEQYTADLVPKIVLDQNKRPAIRIIEGVKLPPPETGNPWHGDDLHAALDMIKLLYGRPFADDIVKVDVTNIAGRVDGREAQVVLVTKWDTQVRWGRPVNAKDFIIEAPVARKLQGLQDVYAQYKRVDAGKPWIDVRFDKITHPVSTPAPTPPAGASANVTP
ncbi:MAG TPA: hypothetical protein VGN72_11720 [Tepidisphaeraceae bacterium]|jgi:hypothetical protein|nr:hypothetical protein [Tepidisphaeraceae bacterium]